MYCPAFGIWAFVAFSTILLNGEKSMKLWMWILAYGLLFGLAFLFAYARWRMFNDIEETFKIFEEMRKNIDEYLKMQDEIHRLLYKKPGQRGS